MNLDSVQVLYETKYPDGKEPIVTRTMMYSKDDHSDPALWKHETCPAAVEPATE